MATSFSATGRKPNTRVVLCSSAAAMYSIVPCDKKNMAKLTLALTVVLAATASAFSPQGKPFQAARCVLSFIFGFI